jgi:hypothetical protein
MAGSAAETPTMTLSDTQRLVLSKASQHEQGLAAAPQGLPAAARDAVFRSMLKNGLLAQCAAPREHAGLAWREDADGTGVALRVTHAGLRAIGVEPDGGAGAAPDEAPAVEAAWDVPGEPDEAACAEDIVLLDQALATTAPPRGTNLRQAAQAMLDAWDGGVDRGGALARPMERLRAALAKPARAAREPGAPRGPREGTKRERVLALLRRPEGASGPQLIEATGWAPHTVRGFLAGLGKKGVAVTVLERVRQVGKDGAKGSYTVYQAPA